MNPEKLHVVVQAGGRGSRLRHHTWNKPKCLVSVKGKPILFHLFDVFHEAKFLIIGDYLFDQLEKYLLLNDPKVDYQLIKAADKGTASGVSTALKKIPRESPVLITWSDLVFNKRPTFEETRLPIVVTTDAFTCRWTVSSRGDLVESPGAENGIPGVFYFSKCENFPDPPDSGEFVKWFSKNILNFKTVKENHLEELGDFSTIEASNDRDGFCRFFNSVEIDKLSNKVTKKVIDPKFESVHSNEVAWYEQAKQLGFRRIPKIYSTSPLVMERIKGVHAYDGTGFSIREKRAILADYLDALTSLHDLGSRASSQIDVNAVYFDKTIARVNEVAALIPFFERESVTVNGKKCRNVFSEKHRDFFGKVVKDLAVDKFTPIHGDPTFSNSIVDDKLRVWFIDPRGSFARPGIFGDPWYDFAKVYYSAVGGYDAFNRRKFKLYLDVDTVEVLMERPVFQETALEIFNDYFPNDRSRIEILHGLIWLAFSGYVKDDIDSVIGSFYSGLFWIEDALAKA